MKKISCVISCPISTYSGYGGRSRDFVRALLKCRPDWDIKILPQRWGSTRKTFLEDTNDTQLLPLLIENLTQKPDVWIQISIPNEFQSVGKYNIGVTAGVETTICDPSWIVGANKIDLIIGSSEHTIESLKRSIFSAKDENGNHAGKISLKTDTEILFEGYDTHTYRVLDSLPESNIKQVLDTIEEEFCFLFVGHWMQGNFGHDRKNVGYTVKAFLETFKNKTKPPALILKTSEGLSSILERDKIIEKIQQLRKTVRGKLPNIYLLFGETTDQGINELYNHPKVKAMISLTKGEGFGRPMLEFSAVGKPIIASRWSGHLDFLSDEFVTLVDGSLENVDSSATVKNILLKESQWFKPDDAAVNRALKDLVKNYKKHTILGKRQKRFVFERFTYDLMVNRLDEILTKNLPEFPEEVELTIPKLKLPKLKKVQ